MIHQTIMNIFKKGENTGLLKKQLKNEVTSPRKSPRSRNKQEEISEEKMLHDIGVTEETDEEEMDLKEKNKKKLKRKKQEEELNEDFLEDEKSTSSLNDKLLKKGALKGFKKNRRVHKKKSEKISQDVKEEIEEIRKCKQQEVIIDTELLFEGAGTSAGLEIWRLQGMIPVKLEEFDERLNNGDCYLILHSHDAKDEESRSRQLHYWMGSKTNMQKRAICSFMAMELTKYLPGGATLYREEEGSESEMFLDYFDNLRYVDYTCSEETLKKPPKKIFEPKLIRIDKPESNQHLMAKRVPMSTEELLESSICILELESKIYIWIGKKSTNVQMIKANDFVDKIRGNYSFESLILTKNFFQKKKRIFTRY